LSRFCASAFRAETKREHIVRTRRISASNEGPRSSGRSHVAGMLSRIRRSGDDTLARYVKTERARSTGAGLKTLQGRTSSGRVLRNVNQVARAASGSTTATGTTLLLVGEGDLVGLRTEEEPWPDTVRVAELRGHSIVIPLWSRPIATKATRPETTFACPWGGVFRRRVPGGPTSVSRSPGQHAVAPVTARGDRSRPRSPTTTAIDHHDHITEGWRRICRWGGQVAAWLRPNHPSKSGRDTRENAFMTEGSDGRASAPCWRGPAHSTALDCRGGPRLRCGKAGRWAPKPTCRAEPPVDW